MRYVTSYHLSPLTLVLLVIFLVVLALALLPPTSGLTMAEMRVAVIAVSGAALILGLWGIRQTNRRLDHLGGVASEIERGDYSARAVIEGGDSIAQLSRAVNRMALQTEAVIVDLQEREQEVLRLSTHDLLTGLPNRRLFNELLLKEVAHARRDGHKLGVVVLDIDGFKNINDGLGQVAGDQILLELAQRILTITREADTVARLGSDSFGLLVSKVEDLHGIDEAMERVWQLYKTPFDAGDRSILMSASAGVGVFPDQTEDVELLVGQAEEALEWCKQRGGKRWAFFEPSMDRKAHARLELSQDFYRALGGDDLLVYYQPICSVRDAEIQGLEALVRWQHPSLGLLSAGQFIPVLEQVGLMPELGSWLLDEICRQATDWQRSGLPAIPISVNVSVQQFEAGDVSKVAAEALDRNGLAADFLQLELTESIAMHDVGQMVDQLDRCQERGIRIHLDDFGTGYSSLSYLLKFPVDVLKIDRSFVAGVPDNAHSAAIVNGTLGMARSLGLGVIAEGVETVEQLEFLRREDCRLAQGYLLSRPVSAEETARLLAQGRVSVEALAPQG